MDDRACLRSEYLGLAPLGGSVFNGWGIGPESSRVPTSGINRHRGGPSESPISVYSFRVLFGGGPTANRTWVLRDLSVKGNNVHYLKR